MESIKNFAKNKGLKIGLIWLIAVNLIGLAANNRLDLKPDNAYSWIPIQKYDQHQSWNLVNIHSRWDSNWYLDIVKNGYYRKADDTLSNVVFFPLYPSLIKGVNVVTGLNIITVAWFLSCLFFLIACSLLFKFVQKYHKESDPLLAVFLLLVFPTAFFLNTIYTESLFLMLSLFAFYFSFSKKYILAGIFGFFAALTRITGILVFLPLAIELVMNSGVNKETVKKMLPLGLIPLGTASFFFFHWINFGDPLLFFRVESAWGRSFLLNKDHFIFLTNASLANFLFDVSYLIFGAAITVALVKIKKYPYAIYMASTIGVAVATGTLMSIGRYILVLFPIYIIGASVKNEVVKYAWIIISAMLMALNTYLFVNWYWAG